MLFKERSIEEISEVETIERSLRGYIHYYATTEGRFIEEIRKKETIELALKDHMYRLSFE